MAPRLLSWSGPMADPGNSSQQTTSSEIQYLTYRAEFDIPAFSEDVYNLPQCPRFFDLYKFNGRTHNNLFLVERECKQLSEAPQVMELRVKFANTFSNFDGKFRFIENPLERPALINWGSYVIREAVEVAKGGENDDKPTPVLTTAGEPLILEEEFHRRQLVIVKNIKSISNDIFAESGDFINEENTKIGGHTFKKLTLLLLPIAIGPLQFENGFLFYEVTMTILHNPNTWIRRVRNAGYYMRGLQEKAIKDETGAIKNIFPLEVIRFSTGVKPDRPLLLNKEGRPLQLVMVNGPLEQGKPPMYDIKSPEDFGRAFTEDELKSTIRYFRTRDKLNFTKSLPLH